MADSQHLDAIDDYARAVRSRWKWMIALGIAGGLLGLGYTAQVRPLFQARSTLLVPAIEAKPGMSSALGGFSPVNMLKGLVSSIELQRRVAADLNIPRLRVEEKLVAKAELNQNQLVLSAIDASPKLALDLVTSANKHLHLLASEAGLGSANRQAVILKRAIENREEELEIASNKLAEFEKTAQTSIDPTNPASALYYKSELQDIEIEMGSLDRELTVRRNQAKAAGRNPELPSGLAGAIDERATLLQAEFEFETARRQLGNENPELKKKKEALDEARRNFEREVASRLRASQQGLDTEIATLEARRVMLAVQRDFWTRLAKSAPKDAIKLMRLNFEVEAIQTVLKGLRAKYDEAALNSEVDAVRWSVLSEPRVEPEPVNKNYGMNAFLGIMVGLFLGGAVSIAKFGA